MSSAHAPENSQAAPGKADKAITFAMVLLAVVMVFYHGLYLFKPFVNAILHQNIHLGMALAMLSLMGMKATQKTSLRLMWVVVAIVSIVVCTYVHIEYERLHMWAGYPGNVDIVVGVTLVILVCGFSWLHWGAVFPILAGVAVLYAFFGHLIAGPMGHPYLDPKLIISNMSVGFDGIYGMMLNTSANIIFFFVIFGSLFESVGIASFFRSIGRWIGGKMRGGAAIGSVASSSLLGMCTGGSMVNVALAGSFTMPMMVEAGFKPTIAGGIEACSSTGGGLTPPVMGIAIFIMASFLNMTYIELVPATIIPAFIFYLGLVLGVICIIKKENIPLCQMSYDGRAIRLGAPVFIIPMALLCYLLFSHYTPAFAAFWTTICLIVVSMYHKATRPSFKTLLDGFVKGCCSMASLALVLALIGIFITMINMTNAGPKLSSVIQMISGGYMLPSLFLTMVLCILLGCALPAPVAYMVVALVVAPGMKDMGIPIVATHLFCFYFSFLSNITPPIAGSAMVAARMLGVSFMRTGWESFKFALPFFVVPYFAIFNPIVTLHSQNVMDATIAVVMLILCSVAIASATWGYFRGKLGVLERIAFTASAILCTISGLLAGMESLLWGIPGVGIFAFVAGWRFIRGTKSPLFVKQQPGEAECVIA